MKWGDDQLHAHGLGAYIAKATADGDYPRIVLGVAVMCIFVILFNRLFWRPLFAFARTPPATVVRVRWRPCSNTNASRLLEIRQRLRRTIGKGGGKGSTGAGQMSSLTLR